ncbi:hypothetical protein GCM10020001_060600 [Nonomuraea salmonea]
MCGNLSLWNNGLAPAAMTYMVAVWAAHHEELQCVGGKAPVSWHSLSGPSSRSFNLVRAEEKRVDDRFYERRAEQIGRNPRQVSIRAIGS